MARLTRMGPICRICETKGQMVPDAFSTAWPRMTFHNYSDRRELRAPRGRKWTLHKGCLDRSGWQAKSMGTGAVQCDYFMCMRNTNRVSGG